MSKEKDLIKNLLIYGIGNFGSKFLNFLLLPLYTFYLTTNEFGYFDLISTTLSLMTPLITFQVFDGLYRYLLESDEQNHRKQVISSSCFIVFRNLAIANLIYLGVVCFINIKYKYLILLQLDFSIVAAMWMQIARGMKDNIKYSIAGIVTTIITLTGNIILISVFGYRVDGLIISNILAALLTVIYLEVRLGIRNFISIEEIKSHKNALISFSLPLIPNALCWWFMSVSDRFILNFYKGIDANGIYAVANKFPSFVFLVNGIFYLAWQESAIKEYTSEDRNLFYTKMFNQYMKIQFTITIILIACTKILMASMVNSKFNTAWMYVPLLYLGAIFASFSSFYGTGYLSSKDTKGALTSSVYAALLNIIINILSIPHFGIQGACFSTMASSLFMWLVRIIQTKKYFSIDIDKRSLFALILISVLYMFLYYFGSFHLQMVAILMSLVVFVLYNKHIFLNVVKLKTKVLKNN